jgi:hypothetical protein
LEKKSKLKVELLLKDFRIIWGNKLTSAINANDYSRLVEIWRESIYNLTDEEIKRALIFCKNTYTFPPSISEFLRAAYDFYSEQEAFSIANSATQDVLENELDCSLPKNIVLLTARGKVKNIFRKSYQELDSSEILKIWRSQYKHEIESFLMGEYNEI